jgi:hypothetical protein
MKKTLSISAAIFFSLFLNAQTDSYTFNRDIFEICATIFTVGMFMFFIITVMKKIFEHRLKNKIVDKGISETVAHSILENKTSDENKYANVKWFAILAGIGIGLTGVNYTQPLGFHSFAIMSFSISLSFIGYYLFIRSLNK